MVDLPQPDSPTRPSVSPLLTSNEMPSTAWTAPTLRWKMMPCREREVHDQVVDLAGGRHLRRSSPGRRTDGCLRPWLMRPLVLAAHSLC